MKTFQGLPLYSMAIDENDTVTGVEFISLVDFPAIEVNWVAMNNKTMKLYAAKESEQTVTGPVMIPDLPIYRSDSKLGEYYVVFSAEEIKKIARKFMAEQRTLGINYMHQDNSQVQGAQIDQYWFIKDKEKDQSAMLGFDLPLETWMSTVYIKDKEFFEKEVKSGNLRGFSIEGYLNMVMSKVERPLITMSKQKFEKVKTANGEEIFIDGEIKVDAFVYSAESQTVLVDSKQSTIQYPMWDNIIELEDGKILTIAQGKILEIGQKEATVVEDKTQNDETKMNKDKFEVKAKTKAGVEITSPADAIAEGVEVFIVQEDGTQVAAPDGDHELENGDVITVVEGKVTAVKVAEAETAEEPAAEVKHAVTPEDIAAIAEALGIAALVARIEALEGANTELAAANLELKEKFNLIPTGSATAKTDKAEDVVLSIHDKIAFLKQKK